MCLLPKTSLGGFSCLELKAVHMDLRDFIGVLPALDQQLSVQWALFFLETQISRATVDFFFTQ